MCIVIALIFVIAKSDYVAHEKSYLQKNTLLPPPFPNPAQSVKYPGAFVLVLSMQQVSKLCGCKGPCSDVPEWCSSRKQEGAEMFWADLASSLLHAWESVQLHRKHHSAAHPGFWWTEEIMWDFSAANFVRPHWGHLFQHFLKAAKLIACFNHHQRSCPFLFQLQGAAVSQAWVEGEILHPDCQLKLARALSCVLGQCVKVLLLEELRVTL